MYNNSSGDRLSKLVGIGAVALALVVYGGYRLLPYVVFFVLPFILGSVLIAGLFLVVTGADEATSSGTRYRRLVVLYPVLILVMLVTFHWGSERVVVKDQKGNIIARTFEWPEFNKAFGGWEKPEKKSFIKKFNESIRESQVFDRREMGWGFWFALFLGGPALFLFWSKDPEEEDEKRFREGLQHRLEIEKESSHRRANEISSRARREEGQLRDRIREMYDHQYELKKEIRELMARTEYSSEEEVPSPSSEVEEGLLDQGIL